MPEFEPDSESIERGESFAFALMKDVLTSGEGGMRYQARKETFAEARYREQANGAPIDDVIANVSQMAMDFAIARRWGNNVICLRLSDGQLAPISMAEYFGYQRAPFSIGYPYWFEFLDRYFPIPVFERLWEEMLARVREDNRDAVEIRDVREVESLVTRNLSDFLSYRFAGIKRYSDFKTKPTELRWFQRFPGRLFGRRRPRTGRTKSGGGDDGRGSGSGDGGTSDSGDASAFGIEVQVSCTNPGLRIHISPAYFINWVVFGSPTTPVTNYVFPGRYIFSADCPMWPRPRNDNGVFRIPPSFNPVLTRF